jgi:hypothetical protein
MTSHDVAQAELVQGSPEWHAARLGKVTSSRFGSVMTKARSGGGISQTAMTYMTELIAERITNRPSEELKNKYVDWGHEHEPTARQLYQWFLPGERTLRQVGFVNHPSIANCGGSPDCLVDDDGVVEIKCPYNAWKHLQVIEEDQIVDKDHVWQCQGNLWVTGRKWLDFVSFCPLMPENMQLHVIRVHRDEDMIEELEEKVPRFLDQLELKMARIMSQARVTSEVSGDR